MKKFILQSVGLIAFVTSTAFGQDKVAVLDFNYDQTVVSALDASFLRESIENGIVECGTFIPVERTRLESLQKEVQTQDVLTNTDAVQLGKTVGAKRVIFGSISVIDVTKATNTYSAIIKFSFKIVNVETSQIEKSQIITAEAEGLASAALAKSNALEDAGYKVMKLLCSDVFDKKFSTSTTRSPRAFTIKSIQLIKVPNTQQDGRYWDSTDGPQLPDVSLHLYNSSQTHLKSTSKINNLNDNLLPATYNFSYSINLEVASPYLAIYVVDSDDYDADDSMTYFVFDTAEVLNTANYRNVYELQGKDSRFTGIIELEWLY